MHLAFLILTDPLKCKIMDGLAEMVSAMRVRFGVYIKAYRNRELSIKWCIDNALQKDLDEALQEIVISLDDPADQERIGFLQPDAFGESDEQQVEMDRMLAAILWEASWQLLGNRLLGYLSLSMIPPFAFYALCSENAEEVTTCLGKLKEWWEALDTLEHLARGNKTFKATLNDLIGFGSSSLDSWYHLFYKKSGIVSSRSLRAFWSNI